MATNTMLQWQIHITDSTDRDAIISNVGVLEQFAGAITGDDSLKEKFEQIRTGIKDGTIKPTEWQTSAPFVQITSKLKESSSGKIDGLDGRLKTAEDDISSHTTKLDEQKQTLTDQDNRLATAEGNITSHEETLSGYGTRLDTAEGTLTSHTSDLRKKLDASTFKSFKDAEFKSLTDWKSALDKKLPSLASATDLEDLDKRIDNVSTLLNKEVSHWTAESTPAPTGYTATANVKASKQPWGTGEDPERHVGDLCTVIGTSAKDKGVSYRFVKDPSAESYKWLKVIDNDGALALNKHSQFVVTYAEDKRKQKEASDSQQEEINDLKSKFGTSSGKLDQLGKNFAEEQRKAEERDKQYKVVVTTKGYIKDGVIVNGESDNGTPVIVHTAHVYDNFGNEKTIEARGKLTWIINKGRKTTPLERKVTELVCKVSQDQFVKDGTSPHYYNIELTSNF